MLRLDLDIEDLEEMEASPPAGPAAAAAGGAASPTPSQDSWGELEELPETSPTPQGAKWGMWAGPPPEPGPEPAPEPAPNPPAAPEPAAEPAPRRRENGAGPAAGAPLLLDAGAGRVPRWTEAGQETMAEMIQLAVLVEVLDNFIADVSRREHRDKCAHAQERIEEFAAALWREVGQVLGQALSDVDRLAQTCGSPEDGAKVEADTGLKSTALAETHAFLEGFPSTLLDSKFRSRSQWETLALGHVHQVVTEGKPDSFEEDWATFQERAVRCAAALGDRIRGLADGSPQYHVVLPLLEGHAWVVGLCGAAEPAPPSTLAVAREYGGVRSRRILQSGADVGAACVEECIHIAEQARKHRGERRRLGRGGGGEAGDAGPDFGAVIYQSLLLELGASKDWTLRRSHCTVHKSGERRTTYPVMVGAPVRGAPAGDAPGPEAGCAQHRRGLAAALKGGRRKEPEGGAFHLLASAAASDALAFVQTHFQRWNEVTAEQASLVRAVLASFLNLVASTPQQYPAARSIQELCGVHHDLLRVGDAVERCLKAVEGAPAVEGLSAAYGYRYTFQELPGTPLEECQASLADARADIATIAALLSDMIVEELATTVAALSKPPADVAGGDPAAPGSRGARRVMQHMLKPLRSSAVRLDSRTQELILLETVRSILQACALDRAHGSLEDRKANVAMTLDFLAGYKREAQEACGGAQDLAGLFARLDSCLGPVIAEAQRAVAHF